jgi:hypothetical protein
LKFAALQLLTLPDNFPHRQTILEFPAPVDFRGLRTNVSLTLSAVTGAQNPAYAVTPALCKLLAAIKWMVW